MTKYFYCLTPTGSNDIKLTSDLIDIKILIAKINWMCLLFRENFDNQHRFSDTTKKT